VIVVPVARRRGITMVELLVALAILAVVSGSVFVVWANSQRVFRESTNLADAQARARVAMRQIEREARSGRRGSVVDAALPSEFAFDTLLPNTEAFVRLRYFVNNAGELIRDVGGSEARVASNVSGFTVTPAAAGDQVTIRLDIQVGERRATLQTLVSFRNNRL
jgi:prepilin-type N-terminal cleavage/methylation domain-containing protein